MRSSFRLAMLVILACGSAQPAPHARPTRSHHDDFDGVPRLRFNQIAMREGIPIHWFVDADHDQAVDPDEVRSLRFYETASTWTDADGFTSAFGAAYRHIIHAAAEDAPSDTRLRAVRGELESTAPTLVYSDLRELPETHRAFAAKMLEVGELIDRLYTKQVGAAALALRVADDTPSRSLFRRNWGEQCLSSRSESVEACSAIEGSADQPVDIYPSDLQEDESFCEALQADGMDPSFMDPFTVVRRNDLALNPVPYTAVYAEEMNAVAARLREAAASFSGEEEPLVAYLHAAATAFESNEWEPADEAWAAMDARNSRWYVRVAPDEVYWDPCSRKAGFHLTFALIDRSSLEWQERLDPLKSDMESALAALVDSYHARSVDFDMPDFIAIVANYGDDRKPFGATIGQSLPNWGAVADEGRGRTVAMSTLYTDPDSRQRRRAQAAALMDETSLALLSDSSEAGLMSTILHEATHNLGPAHGFAVEGQTAAQAFGGELASMLEELKAQSGALFFVEMLRERGVITDRQARETYMDSIIWAFGHIAHGMWTSSGRRKPYSQLAAIQVGFLLDHGVLRWDATETPASGEGQGAFFVDVSNFPNVARTLMSQVMSIKSTVDRDAAIALADRYVGKYDGSGTHAAQCAETVVPHAAIVNVYGRFPRAAMVYAIDL